jgi:hypothetical protein
MSYQLLPLTLWESVPFGDPDAFLDWNLPHWLTHVALAAKTKTLIVPLDELQRDPFPHAQLHQALEAVLGLPAPWDFAGYDLRNKESYNSFMLDHAAAHAQLQQAAGL